MAYSNTNAKSLDFVPEKHKIEYDNFYRVARIVGPYVDPDDDNWFPIDRKNENRYDINDLKEDLFNEKETEFIEVKEQILGKSKEGELVCLPFVNDAHRISITGMSGHGKTLLDHRIKDGIIEKDYGRVIELNDRKEESTVYHQTWKTHEFCSDELQLINEFSKPMPMQYLYPMNNVLEEKGEDTVISENGNIGFSFTIPFEEVLKDRKSVKYYEDWSFGKSIKSLRSLLKDKEFMAFESYEEQESYINAKKSIPHNSKSKICDILSDMWTTNIFDISTGINPYWEYEIDGKRNKE